MKNRIFALATLAAAMVFAGTSNTEAAYSYTVSELTLTPASFTVGLTTIGFDPTVLPASAGAISDFNVADVGAISTQNPATPDTGSSAFTEVMRITDTLGNSETFSLTGNINLISGSTAGIATTFTNAAINIVNVTGSSFGITFAGYAPPTAGTPVTGLSNGALSILVIPPSVPEPASVAMLGLGLLSVGGFALRRRMAK
jgi:hypothetical protein